MELHGYREIIWWIKKCLSFDSAKCDIGTVWIKIKLRSPFKNKYFRRVYKPHAGYMSRIAPNFKINKHLYVKICAVAKIAFLSAKKIPLMVKSFSHMLKIWPFPHSSIFKRVNLKINTTS